MRDEHYRSGGDYRLDFLGRLYEFSRRDFEERLVGAARRLGLTDGGPLDETETADLVELAVAGAIGTPRSDFGRHLAATAPAVRRRDGGDLVYWLRKLVFRSAWLDHRVKHGLVEARYEERTGSFTYLLDGARLAYGDDRDVPTWPAVRFRR